MPREARVDDWLKPNHTGDAIFIRDDVLVQWVARPEWALRKTVAEAHPSARRYKEDTAREHKKMGKQTKQPPLPLRTLRT